MPDDKEKIESVSLEEHNNLKEDFEKANQKLSKLEKIFEERQTKVFDKNNAISKEAHLKE